jgi:hypothetical protein
MIVEILARTPAWVYALFVGLVALGLWQARTRTFSLARLLILPAAMIAFALYGLLGLFGDRAAALAPWLVALIATMLLLMAARYPRGVVLADGHFTVPGSWIPFAVIMAIFFLRYAVTVAVQMNPQLRDSTLLEVAAGFAYGMSSGFFTGRALSIMRGSRNTSAA